MGKGYVLHFIMRSSVPVCYLCHSLPSPPFSYIMWAHSSEKFDGFLRLVTWRSQREPMGRQRSLWCVESYFSPLDVKAGGSAREMIYDTPVLLKFLHTGKLCRTDCPTGIFITRGEPKEKRFPRDVKCFPFISKWVSGSFIPSWNPESTPSPWVHNAKRTLLCLSNGLSPGNTTQISPTPSNQTHAPKILPIEPNLSVAAASPVRKENTYNRKLGKYLATTFPLLRCSLNYSRLPPRRLGTNFRWSALNKRFFEPQTPFRFLKWCFMLTIAKLISKKHYP